MLFRSLVTGSDEEYDDEELFYLKPEAHVRIGPTAVEDVESSYFIVNVPIAQHTSSLQSLFPVENRNSPQNLQYLASILTDQGSFESKMADFHLLLYLSKEVDLDVRLEATLDAPTLMNHLTCVTQVVLGIASAVSNRCAIPEGYKIIIESITGQV